MRGEGEIAVTSGEREREGGYQERERERRAGER